MLGLRFAKVRGVATELESVFSDQPKPSTTDAEESKQIENVQLRQSLTVPTKPTERGETMVKLAVQLDATVGPVESNLAFVPNIRQTW